jgi:hypothetical protein
MLKGVIYLSSYSGMKILNNKFSNTRKRKGTNKRASKK